MRKRKEQASTTRDHRYMIRCAKADLEKWEQHARERGFASAGAWLGRIANERIAADTAKR